MQVESSRPCKQPAIVSVTTTFVLYGIFQFFFLASFRLLWAAYAPSVYDSGKNHQDRNHCFGRNVYKLDWLYPN